MKILIFFERQQVRSRWRATEHGGLIETREKIRQMLVTLHVIFRIMEVDNKLVEISGLHHTFVHRSMLVYTLQWSLTLCYSLCSLCWRLYQTFLFAAKNKVGVLFRSLLRRCKNDTNMRATKNTVLPYLLLDRSKRNQLSGLLITDLFVAQECSRKNLLQLYCRRDKPLQLLHTLEPIMEAVSSSA